MNFKELVKRMSDVHGLYQFSNPYATSDFLLQSGSSDVVVELKTRTSSVVEYDSVLMEEKKLKAMRRLAKEINAKGFYVQEFRECTMIFDISRFFNADPAFEIQMCRKNNHSDEKVNKLIFFLPYVDADYFFDSAGNRLNHQQFLELIEKTNRDNNNYLQSIFNNE